VAASGTAHAEARRPYRRPGQLPGGPHGMTRQQVAENQRGRILAALEELVAERGYPRVKVSDVVRRAGVSRKTFYALYENQEDSFLAIQEAIASRLLERVEAGAAAGATPEQRLDGAIDALVGFCAEEPAAVRTCVVEALAAGERARRRRAAVLDRLAEALVPAIAGLRPGEARPTLVARATIGAVLELSAHSLDRFEGQEPARLAKAIVAARVAA
jgi:AcrR family transcriptional regulator